jgi:SAM-dependent methyltransferase
MSTKIRRTSDRAKYWNDRILHWEAGRYDGETTTAIGFGELLAGVLSLPTRNRLRTAAALLTPFVAGRSVLEIGCGTGRLAALLRNAGCRSYLGIDHSDVAIKAARLRHGARSSAAEFDFDVRPATAIRDIDFDIVVSLGVLDWLRDEELQELFREQHPREFFHSFSERQFSLMQIGHRACRAIDALIAPNAVRPRYLTATHLMKSMPNNHPPVMFYRDAKFRFATFMSSFALSGPPNNSPAGPSAAT